MCQTYMPNLPYAICNYAIMSYAIPKKWHINMPYAICHKNGICRTLLGTWQKATNGNAKHSCNDRYFWKVKGNADVADADKASLVKLATETKCNSTLPAVNTFWQQITDVDKASPVTIQKWCLSVNMFLHGNTKLSTIETVDAHNKFTSLSLGHETHWSNQTANYQWHEANSAEPVPLLGQANHKTTNFEQPILRQSLNSESVAEVQV